MRDRCALRCPAISRLRRCLACGRPGIGWSCRRRNTDRLGAGCGRSRRGRSRRNGSRRRRPCGGSSRRWSPASALGGGFGSHSQLDRYRIGLEARFGKGIVFRLGELNRHRLRLTARECEGDREILVRRHRQGAGSLAALTRRRLGFSAGRHGFELDADRRRLDFRPPIGSRSAGGTACKGQAGAQDDNHSAHVSTVHSEAGSHFPRFEMCRRREGRRGRPPSSAGIVATLSPVSDQ
jgi:hypothetical protein